jgi:hypothetical protein
MFALNLLAYARSTVSFLGVGGEGSFVESITLAAIEICAFSMG